MWLIFQLHDVESRFYLLWEKFPVPPIRIPKCYKSQNALTSDGILVLEDLSKNALVPPPSGQLSLEQTVSVVQELANLHAWSMQADCHWLMEHFPGPERRTTEAVAKVCARQFSQLRQHWAGVIEPEISIIIDHFCTTDHFHYAYSAWKQFEMPPVLCHGDLWQANLFFQKQTNSADPGKLQAIIDWQVSWGPNHLAMLLLYFKKWSIY